MEKSKWEEIEIENGERENDNTTGWKMNDANNNTTTTPTNQQTEIWIVEEKPHVADTQQPWLRDNFVPHSQINPVKNQPLLCVAFIYIYNNFADEMNR